jgi:hypothetical protein
VKKEAESMILDYFKRNKRATNTENKRKDIHNKLKNLDKIEVKVKIN